MKIFVNCILFVAVLTLTPSANANFNICSLMKTQLERLEARGFSGERYPPAELFAALSTFRFEKSDFEGWQAKGSSGTAGEWREIINTVAGRSPIESSEAMALRVHIRGEQINGLSPQEFIGLIEQSTGQKFKSWPTQPPVPGEQNLTFEVVAPRAQVAEVVGELVATGRPIENNATAFYYLPKGPGAGGAPFDTGSLQFNMNP